MTRIYPFRDIEKKWQEIWERDQVYRAEDQAASNKERKFYGLIEFPYPSGEGLHVGHPRSYTAIDIITRKRRMEGKNVLYPIGWDAFGLPTENFAIKHKLKPQDATKNNIANFKRQLQSLGFGFDWSREVNTTDPAYYKWTQWMFLKFFESYFDEVHGRARHIDELAIPDDVEAQYPSSDRATSIHLYQDAHRMAYKAEVPIHWCPSCKIGLAKEEAQGGVCERCGAQVEERLKSQWMIRITKYADRLLRDLDTVDYLDKIKTQQINWIGKSEGMLFTASVKNTHITIQTFSAHFEAFAADTFVVIAPDHPLLPELIKGTKDEKKVLEFAKKMIKKRLKDNRETSQEPEGLFIGRYILDPVGNGELPIWIANFALVDYGTGIVKCSAHDERDFMFAKKYNLRLKPVLFPKDSQLRKKVENLEMCYTDMRNGVLIEPRAFHGKMAGAVKNEIIQYLEKNNIALRHTTYKLRDWVFSRQRYWGEPIPIVRCTQCGYIPVPEKDLPVLLPDVDAYEPTDTGESPLAKIRDWVVVTCPQCGGYAERETDTMPNWAGSSWYFLRYCDPHNDHAFADSEKLKYWMPVDLYNGGMEHTTLHLLYSRFWYKFLRDLGHVPHECGSEPYRKRRSHALILGKGDVKMSKSKGNVVNPDDVVQKYGADVFRVYEMFIGPFDQDAPWDTNGIEGVKRFLEKIWRLSEQTGDRVSQTITREIDALLHQTIKKVSEDIEAMRFNTAVSAMMIFVNAADHIAESFVKILAPFAPHLAEEVWHTLGHTSSIHHEPWPTFDPTKIIAETYELVIQVNGKVRDRVTVASNITEEEATKLALASENVQTHLGGKTPRKIVFVAGKLISLSW